MAECDKHVTVFGRLLITLSKVDANKSGLSLFRKMQSPVHCLNLLLPPKKITDYKLRNSPIMFYLSAVLMFLNDLLLIGPSLVYNFC